ncbi:hypothetical protein HMPREF9371_2246 [Neisseria shayeganii 871]|uniref:Uncharacterized protein n=1 Tax=Neisseria shayeganii 871 TaxID=1032488 RepID=G4CKV5_9NEIS|nr:hypothetical protein HMPREF9371_2246 [Neisseria shayeganii 871]
MICLRSLRCYALNCIHIWGFCKGLSLFAFGRARRQTPILQNFCRLWLIYVYRQTISAKSKHLISINKFKLENHPKLA